MFDENNEEMIGVLYNNSYGGFHLNEKVINLYNSKMLEINPNYKCIKCDDYLTINTNIKRHDNILINIYNELGNDFNDNMYTNIKIKYIKRKYINSYYIKEYDGLEDIIVDINKYKLETIKSIINNNIDNIDNNEKIIQISKIVFE